MGLLGLSVGMSNRDGQHVHNIPNCDSYDSEDDGSGLKAQCCKPRIREMWGAIGQTAVEEATKVHNVIDKSRVFLWFHKSLLDAFLNETGDANDTDSSNGQCSRRIQKGVDRRKAYFRLEKNGEMFGKLWVDIFVDHDDQYGSTYPLDNRAGALHDEIAFD